ncbi:hypothetical protein V3C99_006483 [Haemonchus contortus]
MEPVEVATAAVRRHRRRQFDGRHRRCNLLPASSDSTARLIDDIVAAPATGCQSEPPTALQHRQHLLVPFDSSSLLSFGSLVNCLSWHERPTTTPVLSSSSSS